MRIHVRTTFLPYILMALYFLSIFTPSYSQVDCTADFEDDDTAETINFSSSGCFDKNLTKLIIDNVGPGDTFIFDEPEQGQLNEIQINFNLDEDDEPGTIIIASGVTISPSTNLIISGGYGVIDIKGTLNINNEFNANQNNLTINVSGTLDVGTNFTVKNNANLNIDGNFFVGNDFRTKNNADFQGNGGIYVGTNLNVGNNSDCISGNLCNNIQVIGACNDGNTDFCDDYVQRVSSFSILPVEWLDFDFERSREGVILNWKTASELNNSHFEIERRSVSYDTEFRKIGERKGAGDSREILSYQFLDPRPSVGVNLYRIRQVDFDGTEDVSKTIEVLVDTRELAAPLTLHPNPVYQTLDVQVLPEIQSHTYTLEIINLQGQMVAEKQLISSRFMQHVELDISHLSSGIYMYRVIDGIELSSGKIVKR